MQVELREGTCVVTREPGDPKEYREHTLLYHVRNVLRAQGHDVVKRRMQADGHLMGDETLPYLRERRWHFSIYDGSWQIRSMVDDYNAGRLVLNVYRAA